MSHEPAAQFTLLRSPLVSGPNLLQSLPSQARVLFGLTRLDPSMALARTFSRRSTHDLPILATPCFLEPTRSSSERSNVRTKSLSPRNDFVIEAGDWKSEMMWMPPETSPAAISPLLETANLVISPFRSLKPVARNQLARYLIKMVVSASAKIWSPDWEKDTPRR